MTDLYVIKTTEYMDDGANTVTLATKEDIEAWANSRGFKLVSTEHDAKVIKSNFKRLSEEYMKYPRNISTGFEITQHLEAQGIHYADQLR